MCNSIVSTRTTCWCCQICSFSLVFFGGSLFGSSLLLSATLNRSCLRHPKCCSCLQHIKLLWTLVRDIKAFLSATSNCSCLRHHLRLSATSNRSVWDTNCSCLLQQIALSWTLVALVCDTKCYSCLQHQIALVRDIKSLLSSKSNRSSPDIKVGLVLSATSTSLLSATSKVALLRNSQIALVLKIKHRSCPQNQTSHLFAASVRYLRTVTDSILGP